MKILYLNGSPRKNSGNTKKLTDFFIKGFSAKHNPDITEVTISDQSIQPCTGCFGCWYYTPGKCVLTDDMEALLKAYQQADVIIWSFPLYYFGMPSEIKKFMDRLMPCNTPLFTYNESGKIKHPQIYDDSKQKHVLISTCGFQTIENNYEALIKQFDIFVGERLSKIICPIGGIFATDEPSRPVREYLDKVYRAGIEFSQTGTLSENTEHNLMRPPFNPDMYLQAVNRLIAISQQPKTELKRNPVNPETYNVMNTLAVSFTQPAKLNHPIVIHIYFLDIGNLFSITITKDGCSIDTNHHSEHSTYIAISFDKWLDITAQKISLTQSFVDENYLVWGDFNNILRFDDFFPHIVV